MTTRKRGTRRAASTAMRWCCLAAAVLLAAPAPAAQARPARTRPSVLAAGKAAAGAGRTVVVPVRLRDSRGTPLGLERGPGNAIQAISLAVRCLPAEAVTEVRLRRAGATAKAEPLFEAAPRGGASGALVASFDELRQPLAVGLYPSRGDLVAEIVVTLAPHVAPGTVVELRLDPAVTTLSDQAGTVSETAGNGWLRLLDGRLEVE